MISQYHDYGDGKGPIWVGTSEEEQAYLEYRVGENIEMLWQAAHDYEYTSINGAALSMVLLGVIQNKPKCLAVQNWIQSIWNLYYSRKATITKGVTPECDFSVCGTIPHSIPELMEELNL